VRGANASRIRQNAEKTARRYHSPATRPGGHRNPRRILAAAKRLFVEQGYGKVTVNDIATEAALAVPTVYACTGGNRPFLSTIIDECHPRSDCRETLSAIRQSSAAHDVIGVTAHGTRVDNERYHDIMQVMKTAATFDESATRDPRRVRSPVPPGVVAHRPAVARPGRTQTRSHPETNTDTLWFYFGREAWHCWWPTGTGRGMAPRMAQPAGHLGTAQTSMIPGTLKRRADTAITPPIEADEKGPHLCGPFQWSWPGIEPGA